MMLYVNPMQFFCNFMQFYENWNCIKPLIKFDKLPKARKSDGKMSEKCIRDCFSFVYLEMRQHISVQTENLEREERIKGALRNIRQSVVFQAELSQVNLRIGFTNIRGQISKIFKTLSELLTSDLVSFALCPKVGHAIKV